MEGNGTQEVRNYRDLLAWQKAMNLTLLIYNVTRDWPKGEMDSLTTQIRRAAVEIPSKIAAGYAQFAPMESIRHFNIARDALHEVETQSLIAQRLGYLTPEVAERVLANSEEVHNLLNSLYHSLDT